MKLKRFLIAGGLAASLAIPLAVSAQQAPPPYPPQGGYPQQQQGAPGQAPRQLLTLSAAQIERRYQRLFQNMNLSAQQQNQINQYINTFSQQHPAGSPRDPQAARDLRAQILQVLTPDQMQTYRQERQQAAAQRQARMQQRQQQQQQQQQQPQQQPQGQPAEPQPEATA